jgi:hypothetical protein
VDPAVLASVGAAVLILLVTVAMVVIYQRRPNRSKQPTAVSG